MFDWKWAYFGLQHKKHTVILDLGVLAIVHSDMLCWQIRLVLCGLTFIRYNLSSYVTSALMKIQWLKNESFNRVPFLLIIPLPPQNTRTCVRNIIRQEKVYFPALSRLAFDRLQIILSVYFRQTCYVFPFLIAIGQWREMIEWLTMRIYFMLITLADSSSCLLGRILILTVNYSSVWFILGKTSGSDSILSPFNLYLSVGGLEIPLSVSHYSINFTGMK